MMIYANGVHSYRDLPIRIGEIARDARFETSGSLKGIERVRTFCQNDAHLFVTPEQIESEFSSVVNLILDTYNELGIENFRFELSLRDPEDKVKYYPDDEMWNNAEETLRNVLNDLGYDYVEKIGEAAFYGPKLDIHIKDSLGRVWQCGTIQLDMNLPSRFECTYVDHEGKKQTPIMLHRVVYGSIERFIGILIEHFAGHFPLWLSPEQIVVIPVHQEKHLEYAQKVTDALKSKGLRVELDARNEKLGYRVREAQMKKVPYQIVVGDGEQENETVTIRKSGSKESNTIALSKAVQRFVEEVENKCLFNQ